MLTKLPLLIVPAALVCAAAIALAAPKPAPSQKPQAVPLMPPLEPYYLKPGTPQSMMPNMTQMPDAHVVAAFDVKVPGQRLLLDTSGKVIGHSSPNATHGVIWLDSRPVPAAPKVISPKPKH